MGTNTATVELTSVKKERKPNRGKMKIQLFVVLISVAVVLSQSPSPTPTSSSTKAPTTASKATSTTKAPTTASKATSTTGSNKQPTTHQQQPLEHLHMEQLQFLFYLPVLWLSSQL